MKYTSLKQGSLYYVPFIAPYTSKGPYNIEVSAIAKKSTLEIYGDFDIRGTFFDEVGIKTYLTMVPDDIDIYICHNISNYDPPEVDSDNFIFIPRSIIDFANVDEYKTMTRYSFTIDGIRRSFDSNYDSKNFINTIKETVPIVLKEKTILANDVLSISDTQTTLLVKNSIIEKENKDRENTINARDIRISTVKKQEERREMDYYNRISKVIKREESVTNKESIVEKNVRQAEILKSIGNTYLTFINDFTARLETIYQIIYNQAKDINTSNNMPAWNELKAKIFDSASRGGDISLSMWKSYMEEYIATGKWNEDLVNEDKDKCPLCGTDHNIIEANAAKSNTNNIIITEEE